MSEEYENNTGIQYQELGETVNFIRYGGENIFEFEGEDDKLYWDIREIKKLLQEFICENAYSPEDCIVHINARPQNNIFATIKKNTALFNAAVKKVSEVRTLEIGERVFCFVSQSRYSAVYGISSLVDKGILLTDRRLLFWKGDRKQHVLPLNKIQSLVYSLKWDAWYLNGCEQYELTCEMEDREEIALFFTLLFRLVKHTPKLPSSISENQNNQTETKSDVTKEKETMDSMPVLKKKLEDAKSLFDEGLLTEKEYGNMKEKIIDKFIG